MAHEAEGHSGQVETYPSEYRLQNSEDSTQWRLEVEDDFPCNSRRTVYIYLMVLQMSTPKTNYHVLTPVRSRSARRVFFFNTTFVLEECFSVSTLFIPIVAPETLSSLKAHYMVLSQIVGNAVNTMEIPQALSVY